MAGYFSSAIYRREVERVSPVYTTRANMNVERLSVISIYYPNLVRQLISKLFLSREYEIISILGKDITVNELFQLYGVL